MFNQEEEEDATEKTATFFRFEDLRVYHKSLDYINWLSDISTRYPKDDQTQLIKRWNQSARNIAFFISEGSSRNKSQFIYYLKMTKSAIRECVVCSTIANRANNLSEKHEEVSRGYMMEMTKMIGALISSLQRASNSGNQQHGNHGNEYQGNSRGNYGDHMPMEPDYNVMMGDY